MTTLERALLGRVVGGGNDAPNRTRIRTPDGQETYSERTDFAYCQDVVERNCAKATTSWLFGPNDRAAAQCTLDKLPERCPPTLSGGPKAE